MRHWGLVQRHSSTARSLYSPQHSIKFSFKICFDGPLCWREKRKKNAVCNLCLVTASKSMPFFLEQNEMFFFLFTKLDAFSKTGFLSPLFLFNKFCGIDPAEKPVLLMGSLLIQCSCHQSDLAAFPQCHYTLGAGLFSYTRPQLLDPTSSTSRTQTFVGLISSA